MDSPGGDGRSNNPPPVDFGIHAPNMNTTARPDAQQAAAAFGQIGAALLSTVMSSFASAFFQIPQAPALLQQLTSVVTNQLVNGQAPLPVHTASHALGLVPPSSVLSTVTSALTTTAATVSRPDPGAVSSDGAGPSCSRNANERRSAQV